MPTSRSSSPADVARAGAAPAGASPAPLLVCDRLDKRFGATHAVRGVSLALAPGRTLTLMGENGAGKSTLMAMIAGDLRPDGGAVRIDRDARRETAVEVAVVHQELSLFGNLTVAENVCIGREPRRRSGRIDNRALRAQAEASLARVGVELEVDAPVERLSPAERQLVEIVRAVALDPALLILDEPTSSLEPSQVDLLFEATERLKAGGTSVVFVSHRLDEVFRFADEIAVMRGGELVASGPAGDFTRDSLVNAMVGRELEQLYPPRAVARAADERPLLALEGVGGHGVRDVTLAIRPGEIVGVAGLEGHGQHTVAELAAGVLRAQEGRVLVDGEAIRLRSPRDAIAAGIAFVPPDRRGAGLMLPLSIAENLTVAAEHRLHARRVLRRGRERRAIVPVAERLQLRFASLDQRVGELSGGNQQKVLFGRWLLLPHLRVLVLDDPTRGVDVGARAEIYGMLRELTQQGLGVLLVSTDMLELIGLADRIHVMYEGAVRGTVAGHDATQEDIMSIAAGASR
ncbi:MAG: transporter related protein [Conexibacter sp.]|nr:transporter related protein [Conexibacter sp.]